MGNQKTGNTKKLVIISATLILAAVLAGIVIAVTAGSGGARLQEQLDLGAKYLEELDYERAVAAYEAVLKVDPKNAAAYEGIVEAYRGLGDADKAMEYAKKGYEETGEESLSAYVALLEEEKEDDVPNASGDASESRPEQAEQVQPEKYLEELFDIGGYESYGLAYGGSIPVLKDGKWGAVNFQNEVIVPFGYDGFWASPDDRGNFVLYNTTGQAYRYNSMGQPYQVETREYFLFDNQGGIVYRGADEVRASGGMYITVTAEVKPRGTAYHIGYHSMDGDTLAYAEDVNYYMTNQGFGFYDGISNLISGKVRSDSGETEQGQFVGTVDLQGNLSWRESPDYAQWKLEREAEEARRDAEENNQLRESSGHSNTGNASTTYAIEVLFSTANHGYYVTSSLSFGIPSSVLRIYDGEDKKAATVDYRDLVIDENGRLAFGERNFDNAYRGFRVDGSNFFNYGSKMVFTVGEKNVLIDFAKNTAGAEAFSTEETVLAVYDYIAMADEKYWLVQSGESWGYIDREGKEMAMYQDAGAFVNGYALIKEDGEAWLIDESFQKIENLGPADSVTAAGELYCVTVGEEKHLYALTGRK